MTPSEKNFWELPPLSPEDQRLRDVYIQVGRPVDQLPYTPDFEKLVKILGWGDSPEIKYSVFQRLLMLRKRGRLPQVGESPADLL